MGEHAKCIPYQGNVLIHPTVGSYDQVMQALVHAERGAYGDLS
jgi:hypothetical protein